MALSKHKWDSFLWTADEFVFTYAKMTFDVSGPTQLFFIGHAVEMYLKAANTKFTGDIDSAVSFGHKIRDLWNDCKNDSTFMPNYEIRNSVYDKPFLEEDISTLYSQTDFMHYLKNQSFYIIAKHLMDLKYSGAPLKSIKKPYGIASVSLDPFWIEFLKELRTYLDYPSTGIIDKIKLAIESGELDSNAAEYLKELYKPQKH
jgi:hypothetical protein